MGGGVTFQQDLHLLRTGVPLGLGVVGDDPLLGLRLSSDRHSVSRPGFRPYRHRISTWLLCCRVLSLLELPLLAIWPILTSRARACSPGHSGSAAVVRQVLPVWATGQD